MKVIVMCFIGLIWSQLLQAQDLPISPGDQVKFSILGSPELTTEGVISFDGFIELPLVGTVNVEGMHVSQAEKIIEDSYVKGGFFRSPEVSFRVLNSIKNQVILLGVTSAPGKYPIGPNLNTLFDLLASAGGLASSASKNVVIVRNTSKGLERLVFDIENLILKGTLAELNGENLKLSPGDMVYIQDQPVFYTFGEFRSNSVYPYKKGMLVSQAISIAGGLTEVADDDIVIKRLGADGRYNQIEAQFDSEIFENDILIVKESLF